MKALALDLGGSGGKIFLGSFDGKKIDMKEVHRFHNGPIETAGHTYWDIMGNYANLLEGIRKAASEGFDSVGVESFCDDFGLLDRDGRLYNQIYTYRDKRTIGIPEKMDLSIDPLELYRRTGCQRARFNTLVELVAQMGESDRFLLENASAMLFLPDLLDYFLCGEKAAEYTIASVSQAYDRHNNCWDRDILQRFNIPERIFPRVVPTSTILGKAKQAVLDETGAKGFTVCTVCHHDTASAVMAVPSLEKHFAYISSGTWCLMGTELDGMITSEEAYHYNFANEGGFNRSNRFLKNIMGLWLIQECKRQFDAKGMILSYAELDAEAEKAKPFRSLINPDDPLFFEPGDMIGKIQKKCREHKQPVPETPGEVNRCIKESLALTYRMTLERIEKLAGYTVPAIHIIGGGAQSILLNRFTASATGRPVLTGPIEAAAAGNLCAQFIAHGEMSGIQEARQAIRNSFEIKEYLPENTHAWDEAYGRFTEIAG